jgi:hypothetical protein
VTEEDARLALLQTELNSLQNTIRAFDAMAFQIKGWCVTTALAVGGFAVVYHKLALLVVGLGAVLGFFIIESQIRMIQRAFISRNGQIANELIDVGIMDVLKGAGSLRIVGTGVRFSPHKAAFRSRLPARLPDLRAEMGNVSTLSLYLLIAFCLLLELLILAL